MTSKIKTPLPEGGTLPAAGIPAKGHHKGRRRVAVRPSVGAPSTATQGFTQAQTARLTALMMDTRISNLSAGQNLEKFVQNVRAIHSSIS